MRLKLISCPENTISTLQDLCIDTLVNHLPNTIPHVNVLSEELLLHLVRKIGQSGQLAPETLTPLLAHAPYLSEISLSTCGDAADDAWMEAIVASAHCEHLLKVDLSNCKRVTDAALQALSRLPSLRVVVVDGDSEVTSAGVVALKEKVPDVSVVRAVAMGGEAILLEFASAVSTPAPMCGSAAN